MSGIGEPIGIPVSPAVPCPVGASCVQRPSQLGRRPPPPTRPGRGGSDPAGLTPSLALPLGCPARLLPSCRNAQMAGRASVELHTLIFFRSREVVADARVTKASLRRAAKAGLRSGVHACLPPQRRKPRPRSLLVTASTLVLCCACLPPQVRANGLIVFVPKYGIEGPVYLEDSAAAAAAAAAADGGAAPGGSRGGGKGKGAAAAAAAESSFVYDEEKQVGVDKVHGWALVRQLCAACRAAAGHAPPVEAAAG